MIGASDNETHSYLEIVDAINKFGATPKKDSQELWRRIIFNILISNTDDHLRNHGFLYHSPSGWELSPAYDLNPVPIEIKPRVLATNIDLQDSTASLDLALEVAEYFGLKRAQAIGIIGEVAAAVVKWRNVAGKLGIASEEINQMASAFEHEDLRQALQ